MTAPPVPPKALLTTRVVAAALLLIGAPHAASADPSPVFVSPSNGPAKGSAPRTFTGRWATTYGHMTLEVDGDRVTGSYVYGDKQVAGTLKGTVAGARMTFEWDEPKGAGHGRGRFDLSDDGRSFKGRWGQDTSEDGSGDWTGTREGDP